MERQSPRVVQDYEQAVCRLILYTIGETPFSLGPGLLIGILKGGKSAYLLQHNLHRIVTYGILPTFTRDYLQSVVAVLIDCKLLQVERTPGLEYLPFLKLTEQGRLYLDGQAWCETPFAVRLGDKAVVELSQPDQVLFEALRQVRLSCSSAKGMPAYTVCSDTVLREIAQKKPATPEELLAVRGIGDKFVTNYGEAFLMCIDKSVTPRK